MRKVVKYPMMIVRVCVAICLFCVQNRMIAQNGFEILEMDGKYGLSYNGEQCLQPRFSFAKDVDPYSVFLYKEDGKWGVANVWKKITEPIYDSLVVMKTLTTGYFGNDEQYRKFLFMEKGLWGICDTNGNILLPASYEEINDVYIQTPESFTYFYSFRDQRKVFKNNYFRVKVDGKAQLVDLLGNVINAEDEFLSSLDNIKGQKKAAKFFLKEERKRLQSNSLLADSILRIMKSVKIVSLASNLYLKSSEDVESPSAVFMGKSAEGERYPLRGDTIKRDGCLLVTNDYGFDSTPIMYDSPYFRIQRNPNNVYAYADLLGRQHRYGSLNFMDIPKKKIYVSTDEVENGSAEEEIEILEHFINEYKLLCELAESIGEEKAIQDMNDKLNQLKHYLYQYEEGVRSTEKTIRLTNTLSAIGNALQGATNAMAAYKQAKTGHVSTTYTSLGGTYGTSGSTGASSGNKYNISEQTAYNTDKRTYSNYDSMLAGYFAGNRNASLNEVKQWQSEMKKLRTKWESKGKSFPHSSNESR